MAVAHPFESNKKSEQTETTDEMKNIITLSVHELEERIAPSATGNPGNNNPGENNTNQPGNQPGDGGGGGGGNPGNNNPGENNTNNSGNETP